MFFPKLGGPLFEAREIGAHELNRWREFPHFSGPPEMWRPDLSWVRRLLEVRSGFAYVVEDLASRAVVAYKITLFASSDFAPYARTLAAENRAGQALEAFVNSCDQVIGSQQLALDNGGAGVTAVSLGAWDHNVRDPHRQHDLGRMLERCVLHAHAGFKLKEFLLYACSAEHAHYVAQGGALLCGSTAGTAPYLLGVTREQARTLYGRTVAGLFDYHAPVLSLS